VKVKDLKIGMMLTVDSSERQFKRVYSGEWLAVVHRDPRRDMRYYRGNRNGDPDKVAMYIGRKKDIGNPKVEWSDRFVLFENSVLPVDPTAWRYIQELEK